MTKPLIDQAVDRFLGWKLPEDFAPDGGVTFKPIFNEGTPHQFRSAPTGTNLLHAGQAKAMLEYVAEPLLARVAELEGLLGKAYNHIDTYYDDAREVACDIAKALNIN